MNINFGDFCHTAKPLPNVKIRSEVQICAIAVHKGRVQCSAVLFNSNGEYQGIIGPYPVDAFALGRECTAAELKVLINLVTKGDVNG